MLKLYSYEGKTKEEIEEKILKDLEITIDDCIIEEEETEAKLFKSKKKIYKLLKKEDIKNEIKSFFKFLESKTEIEINAEIKEIENTFNILLFTSNNSILIGKDGRVLNSLQLLLKQSLNTTPIKIKIQLDISNYKAKKIKNMEYEIKKIASSVLKSKVSANLDPMNSYERRIVHTIISEFENLETESIGEEPNRYVVIKYKEN